MDTIKTVGESKQKRENTPLSPRRGNLFVFTGPSGVGKGTICKQLLAGVTGLRKSISVTTRNQRPGEEDGVNYFFRTVEQFEQMRAANQLMESAEFAGSYYGTPKQWVIEQLDLGFDVILEIEVQGAKQVMQRLPEAVLVFVSPPSFEDLRARLVGRGTETPEKIALRLSKAQQEMRERHLFHYEVVNDNVEHAVLNLAHIVYAERCRIRQSTSESHDEHNQNP
ncbi:MAG TPA: guanylate kinase [Candidatus Obscuribacterales bacterium]